MDDLLYLTGSGAYHWPAGDVHVIRDDDPFLFVSDENKRDFLEGKDDFEHVEGETLEAALDADADDVTASIEAGEWDNILNYLLYAEQEHENRREVCESIVQRSDTIKRQREDDDSSFDPVEITVRH